MTVIKHLQPVGLDELDVYMVEESQCEQRSHARQLRAAAVAVLKLETDHKMRIPERDVTYVVLSVYLLKRIDRYPLNWNQSH